MYDFFVTGEPIPQGSMSYFNGHVVDQKHTRLKMWRNVIRFHCASNKVKPLLDQAVQLDLIFYLHKGKTVKRALPYVKPDLDKLVRGVMDALSGFAFKDDAQVTSFGTVSKIYGKRTGVRIRIRPAPTIDDADKDLSVF